MSGYGFCVGTSGFDDEDRLVDWQRTDTNLDQNRTHGPTHERLTALPPLPPGEVRLSGPGEGDTDIYVQDSQQTIADYPSGTSNNTASPP